MKNTTEESVELLFELRRSTLDRYQAKSNQTISEKLYGLGGVESVNIVAQADEIGS